jgi:hypothetical protein
MADRMIAQAKKSEGRAVRYKTHSRAKAEPQDVRRIRALIKKKRQLERKLAALTHDAIGEKFGLSGHAVRMIASGRTWGGLR